MSPQIRYQIFNLFISLMFYLNPSINNYPRTNSTGSLYTLIERFVALNPVKWLLIIVL